MPRRPTQHKSNGVFVNFLLPFASSFLFCLIGLLIVLIFVFVGSRAFAFVTIFFAFEKEKDIKLGVGRKVGRGN